MACSPIFGFFRYTFFSMIFTRSHGPMEYYGTPRRCLAAILADLQAIVGNRHWKHGNSLKMHSDDYNLLWGSKIIKNHKKWIEDTRIWCFKLPELKKMKKPHLLSPPRQPLPTNPPILLLMLTKAKFFVWYLFISSFWPKTISFQLVKHI